MIILQESSGSQTINFIPRSYTSGLTYTISITNELKGISAFSDSATSFTLVDYYYTYSNTFTNLKQDNYYMLEIKQGTDVVFKDKIFVTNQTLSTYSVNNNEYTEQTSNNEFIIYE